MLTKADTVVAEELEEVELTTEEKDELINLDPDYLQYSPEVVGYDNREQQWETYRIVTNYMGDPASYTSVMDFGCGRGDYLAFHTQEYGKDLIEYYGVDLNQPLIEAGKEVNPEFNIEAKDWFDVKDAEGGYDWCININSSNLRYDATMKEDIEYLHESIRKMYECAKQGIVVLMTSMHAGVDDEFINWNPGDLLNWAIEEFGGASIDHSLSKETFSLIIYKQ